MKRRLEYNMTSHVMLYGGKKWATGPTHCQKVEGRPHDPHMITATAVCFAVVTEVKKYRPIPGLSEGVVKNLFFVKKN